VLGNSLSMIEMLSRVCRVSIGSALAMYRDFNPWNQGDINLGVFAANIGAGLAAGRISMFEVAGEIATPCKK